MGLTSIAEIIRTHGTQAADKPALEYEGRTITFGELHQQSSRVANGLAAAGVGAQEHVAFVDKNGPEFFEVFFGIAKINAVGVAVNWRLAPSEMAFVINDAQA